MAFFIGSEADIRTVISKCQFSSREVCAAVPLPLDEQPPTDLKTLWRQIVERELRGSEHPEVQALVTQHAEVRQKRQ